MRWSMSIAPLPARPYRAAISIRRRSKSRHAQKREDPRSLRQAPVIAHVLEEQADWRRPGGWAAGDIILRDSAQKRSSDEEGSQSVIGPRFARTVGALARP